MPKKLSMKWLSKTYSRQRVKCITPYMDWTEEGLVVRWGLFGVTVWKREYIHPFNEPI